MRSVGGTQGSSAAAGIGSTAGTTSPSGASAAGASGFGAVLGASVASNAAVGDRPGASNQEKAGDQKDNGATSDQGDTASSLAALLDALPAGAGLDQALGAATVSAGDGTTIPAAADNKNAHPGDGKKPASDAAAPGAGAANVPLPGALLVAAPVTTAPVLQGANGGDTAATAPRQADDSASAIDAQPANSLAASAPAQNRLLPGATDAEAGAAATGSHAGVTASAVAAQAAVSSETQATPEAEPATARAVADLATPPAGSTKKIIEPRHAAASPLAAKTGADSLAPTSGMPATEQDAAPVATLAPAVMATAGLGNATQRDPAGSGDLPNLPSPPDASSFSASAVGVPSLAPPAPAPDISASAAGAPAAPELVGADGARQAMASAVTTQVLSMIANGHDQVTLHVAPPELGSLTLRVDVQANNVSTWFGAAQPQVQQAVSAAITQLQTSLNGAGFNLVGAWVGADASAGGGQQAMPQPARRPLGIGGQPDAAAARIGDTDSSRVSVYV